MKRKLELIEKSLCYAILLVLGSVYLCFFISRYIHFGAEGILINGLVRMLSGEPYFSGLESVPLVLTTYFPTFYILYYPIGKILSLTDAQEVAYLARSLTPLYFGVYSYLVYRLLKLLSKKTFSLQFFYLIVSLFIAKEFIAIFSFKPDMHSFFVELIAFLVFLNYLTNKKIAYLLISAILFAMAFLVKANTIGFGVGAGLTLLVFKKWRDFSLFSSMGLLVMGVGLFTIKSYLGEELFLDLLETTQSNFLSIDKVFLISWNVLLQVILPYFVVFFFMYLSLKGRSLFKREQSFAIGAAVVLSSILAFIGQFKYGAYYNYFFGVLMISCLIAPMGFEKIEINKSLKKRGVVATSLMLAIFLILLLKLPARVILNDNRNYNYVEMNKFLDNNFQPPMVYVESNNGAAHLAYRAKTGPSFLVFMDATKSINDRQEHFRGLLSLSGGMNTVVALGRDCENFTPDPRMEPLVSHLNKKVYHKGKICIFAKE